MGAGNARLNFVESTSTDADRLARKKLSVVFYIEGGAAALSGFREKVKAQGMNVGEMQDYGGSLRKFVVEDPDGYLIAFNTNVR
jgi:hypothetical protein